MGTARCPLQLLESMIQSRQKEQKSRRNPRQRKTQSPKPASMNDLCTFIVQRYHPQLSLADAMTVNSSLAGIQAHAFQVSQDVGLDQLLFSEDDNGTTLKFKDKLSKLKLYMLGTTSLVKTDASIPCSKVCGVEIYFDGGKENS